MADNEAAKEARRIRREGLVARISKFDIPTLERILAEVGDPNSRFHGVVEPELPEGTLTLEDMWPQMEDRIARIVMKSDAKRAVPAFLAAAKLTGRLDGGKSPGDRNAPINLNILVSTPEGKRQLLEMTKAIDHEPGAATKVT